MANLLRSLKSGIKRRVRPWIQTWAEQPGEIPESVWDLRRGASGLEWGGHRLVDLAAQFGSPLHVLDLARLERQFAELSGVDVFCSYKTHPLPAVLQRLHRLGAGAEVVSEMELMLALRLGVPPDRIIYNGPAKSDASIRTAIEQDILLLNLNHREELPRVARTAKELGRRARVGVRVNPGSGWSQQFGTPIQGGAARALIEEALATPEVELIGLHSHRGALMYRTSEVSGFLAEMLGFAAELEQALGWTPEILDVGGGLATPSVRFLQPREQRLAQTFGVPPAAPQMQGLLDRRTYADQVRRQVQAHYALRGRTPPRVVTEVGRGLTADAQLLIGRVIDVRLAADGTRFAILDSGINLAAIMRGARHQIFDVARPDAARDVLYRLAGPICQPGDVICNAVKLPELAPGCLLAIMDSGAYFEPDSTAFSFPRPATVSLDGGEVRIARRRETLQDVFMRDGLDS